MEKRINADYEELGREKLDEKDSNKALLEERDDIQAQLDTWYMQRVGHQAFDIEEHMAFLTEIGYLVPDGPAFSVSTSNVDPEIASMAGPQLVCPVGE